MVVSGYYWTASEQWIKVCNLPEICILNVGFLLKAFLRTGQPQIQHKMETLLIEITNKKAYRLLKDLEDLNIIKVLEKNSEPQQKLSEKYAGKLPSDVAEDLQKYITKSRKEWDNNNI